MTVIEELQRASEQHSLETIGATIGVSKQLLSHILRGKRDLTPVIEQRWLAHRDQVHAARGRYEKQGARWCDCNICPHATQCSLAVKSRRPVACERA